MVNRSKLGDELRQVLTRVKVEPDGNQRIRDAQDSPAEVSELQIRMPQTDSIEPGIPSRLPAAGQVALGAWQMVPRKERASVAKWGLLVLALVAGGVLGSIGMYLVAKGWRP